MIITVSTLLSLLQVIKRFNLHVLKTRKLTLFSWGNILHVGISVNVYFITRISNDYNCL